MPGGMQCPECNGAGSVHIAQYDRTQIKAPTDERKWRKNYNSVSYACADTGKSVTCRVCGGRGNLG